MTAGWLVAVPAGEPARVVLFLAAHQNNLSVVGVAGKDSSIQSEDGRRARRPRMMCR